MISLEKPQVTRSKRNFLPDDFNYQNWEQLKPFFEDLINRQLPTKEALIHWLKDWSEMEAYLSEDLAWRYIRYTCDTEDEEIRNKYLFFINEIKPQIAPYNNQLDKRFIDCEFTSQLDDSAYKIYQRSIKTSIELYREENIPLESKAEEIAQQYADKVSQMTIIYQGEEYTLSQAAKFMKDADRQVRKDVYELVNNRRLHDKDALDEVYDELIKIRHQIALNAGFENFRDYKFKALGRFDYSLQDVFNFHESIHEEILPIVNSIQEEKRKELNLDSLKPYDVDAEPEGKVALKPFKNSQELVEKTILLFSKLHPILGEYLTVMHDKGYLDLDARKGKAPGGYNYPLDEIGIPFIFMNSSGKFRDLVTMLHEGGHAIHSFVTRDLELCSFKHTPSEVAELASMSMELISMEHWDIFFENSEDLKRAKKEQLEGLIDILPWIATVDKFQNWVYTHPTHTREERTNEWLKIYDEFQQEIDFTGYENYKKSIWQKQLHIFEVPFYYIEYGIAQLGAIAVWKNFKQNPEKGLEGYLNALRLGYTQSVPDIYKAAGIEFNFSRSYIKELAAFIKEELNKL
ncbi:MAG: M3 family oligoendopeptidase [Bacteroidetes bacterium]|nr:M3 family oligoendopeptidase [Bacteroidota bacterium]